MGGRISNLAQHTGILLSLLRSVERLEPDDAISVLKEAQQAIRVHCMSDPERVVLVAEAGTAPTSNPARGVRYVDTIAHKEDCEKFVEENGSGEHACAKPVEESGTLPPLEMDLFPVELERSIPMVKKALEGKRLVNLSTLRESLGIDWKDSKRFSRLNKTIEAMMRDGLLLRDGTRGMFRYTLTSTSSLSASECVFSGTRSGS